MSEILIKNYDINMIHNRRVVVHTSDYDVKVGDIIKLETGETAKVLIVGDWIDPGNGVGNRFPKLAVVFVNKAFKEALTYRVEKYED